MKCIIVDDEPLAIEIMETYVSRVDHLKLCATFRNAVSAFTYLQQHSVDLIFLDIQMPKLSGIDFVKTLRSKPKVIFTTAFRDYALDGFDLEIIDYLLKPIPFDRFLKAVAKANQNPVNAITEKSVINTGTEDGLCFKVDKKTVKCKPSDIVYIESNKDYVKIRTGEKEIVTQMTISSLEEKLPSYFLRVHRSFIVNLKKVDAFSASDIELGKVQIPIGRNYKNDVLKVLNQ